MEPSDRGAEVGHLDGAGWLDHLRAVIARNAGIVASTHALVARTSAVLAPVVQPSGERRRFAG